MLRTDKGPKHPSTVPAGDVPDTGTGLMVPMLGSRRRRLGIVIVCPMRYGCDDRPSAATTVVTQIYQAAAASCRWESQNLVFPDNSIRGTNGKSSHPNANKNKHYFGENNRPPVRRLRGNFKPKTQCVLRTSPCPTWKYKC